ncbi:SPFH domain-containing protein [Fastidiosipila sanguinis]|uniref:Virion core protein n=1 Tax=Fastidiosipila sanguinis TaxID=236753 RepID=A0A2S0KM88_9FIRM|nr:SPFH domain-containing protein [Fastidiosipila sanguinis]AVM42128.1 virion core protein [Fastidiosipila sanguinis]
MGLIKAISGAIGGAFGDQWLEAIEADNMTDRTIMAKGVAVRAGDRRSSNTRGTEGVISNGSMIHVYPNQMMMLVENGKIIDYTAEPGAYRVDNSSSPSLFNGQFGDSLKDTWDRFKYGGTTPHKQEAVFINLQELRDIKFGTKNPIQYFDNFYNSELFVRCFGNYSIKVVDPILFYVEVADKSRQRQDVDELGEQFSSEFMTALSTSINKMSADGFRISHLTSRTQELADYMSDALDKTWEENRGFEVKAVGINGISYSEESQELINMRNQGAMLGDPTIREAYVQGSIARGMEAAGSNEGGAGQAFLGMGIGLNSAGGFTNSASEFNRAQLEAQQAAEQAKQSNNTAVNTQDIEQEITENSDGQFDLNFCPNCGKNLPKPNPNFCPNCGGKLK